MVRPRGAGEQAAPSWPPCGQTHVVAWTGERSELPAPALKSADFGIAMGRREPEVDERIGQDEFSPTTNFCNDCMPCAKGAPIFANIRKFLRYLLSFEHGRGAHRGFSVSWRPDLIGWRIPGRNRASTAGHATAVDQPRPTDTGPRAGNGAGSSCGKTVMDPPATAAGERVIDARMWAGRGCRHGDRRGDALTWTSICLGGSSRAAATSYHRRTAGLQPRWSSRAFFISLPPLGIRERFFSLESRNSWLWGRNRAGSRGFRLRSFHLAS